MICLTGIAKGKREDTPMKQSPLGKAIQRIAGFHPEWTPEACETAARAALDRAAGSKRYQIRLLSPEQERREAERHRVFIEKARLRGVTAPRNAK